MASRTLNVVITGDSKQFERAMGNVTKQTNVVEGRFKRFSSAAAGAFAVAGTAAAGALVVGLTKSVQAAQEAEISQAKLQAQLKASGISFREHATEIDRVIQKTSQLSGLDDEELQNAFTNIVRVTGDVNQSLKLTGLAADFARAKHMDVAKAGELVGKVAGGNTGILSRYGIQIQKGASATEALGVLQQKFSGQAAAYGRTAAGANDRFRTAVENLQEKIGKALLPVLTRATNRVATFVNQMANGTGAGGRFATQMRLTADALRPFFKVLGDVAGAIAGVTRWLGRAAGNVSLFVDDVRTGSRVTGSFGKVLHDIGVTVGNVGRVFFRVARGGVEALVSAFTTMASAISKVVSSVRWLIDHIPRIPRPKIPDLNPFGSPRQGWEQMQARLNAGAAMPQTGTYGKAQSVARKFGLRVTSGYRSPQHNAAVGGVPNSLHTHGSPGNPGAIDLVGPVGQMYAAQEWARGHLNLRENLVHNVGSGLHLHLGFFKRGGRVPGQGSGDKMPAMLEPGEFVVNRRAARALGPQLEALNRGIPRFQSGGFVTASTLDRDIALAALTPETSDDLAALEAKGAWLEKVLILAKGLGTPENVTDVANQISGTRASIQSIKDAEKQKEKEERDRLATAIEEQNRLTGEANRINAELRDEVKRHTNFATSVAATEAGAMARWVQSVLSTGLGVSVAGRGLTPSWGVARRS